jgi:tetratricopeptide (TPR) repeat protein
MCPSEEDLRRYLDGELGEADNAAVDAHLQDCPRCFEASEAMVDKLPQEIGEWGMVAVYDEAAANPEMLPSELVAVHRFSNLVVHEKGGMGRVFSARDDVLRRRVAIKTVRTRGPSTDLDRRFRREIEISATLDHPGILPVHGQGVCPDGRTLFFVMKFIDGCTLRQVIDAFHRGTGPDPDRDDLMFRNLLGHFTGACQTVAYAHGQGVIHRDLKPSNIMVGTYGETLVIDWGLAGRIATGPTGDSGPSPAVGEDEADDLEFLGTVACGSPGYSAPEQLFGNGDPCPATDVYSLGAILGYLLTGKNPGACGLAGKGLDAPGTARPVDGSAEVPGAPTTGWAPPQTLLEVVEGAMKDDPALRYQSVDALLERVERWLATVPEARERERMLWAADGAEQLANAEIAGDDIASAARVFLRWARDVAGLNDRLLAARAARLAARAADLRRVVLFEAYTDVGERLLYYLNDDQALAAFEDALQQVHINPSGPIGGDWPRRVPASDQLPPPRFQRLVDGIFRVILLHAATSVRLGLLEPDKHPGALSKAADLASAAEQYRPGDPVARVISWLAAGRGIPPQSLLAMPPASAADSYIAGLTSMILARLVDDPVVSLALAGTGLLRGQGRDELEARAEHHLRTASVLDPAHVWSTLWLGQLLRARATALAGRLTDAAAHRFAASERAFNQCVALRPDLAEGYVGRGEILMMQMALAPDHGTAVDFARLGLPDYESAVTQAPGDPNVRLARAMWLLRYTRGPLAVSETARACELAADRWTAGEWAVEEPPEPFTEARGLLRAMAEDRPEDAAVWSALALAGLAVGDPEGADADAGRALSIDPDEPRALTVRATLRLSRGEEVDLALDDFRCATKHDPSSYRAALGAARALARLGEDSEAYGELTRACGIAARYWQRSVAREELARLCARLNLLEEAQQAQDAARSPWLSDSDPTDPAGSALGPVAPAASARDGRAAPTWARGICDVLDALLYHAEGRLEMASAALGRVLEADPGNQYAAQLLGRWSPTGGVGKWSSANEHYLGSLSRCVGDLPCKLIWDRENGDGFRFLALALLRSIKTVGNIAGAEKVGRRQLYVETREMRWYVVELEREADREGGLIRLESEGWCRALDYSSAVRAVSPLSHGSILVPPLKLPRFDESVALGIARDLGEASRSSASQFIAILVAFLGEALCLDLLKRTKENIWSTWQVSDALNQRPNATMVDQVFSLVRLHAAKDRFLSGSQRRKDGALRTKGGVFFQTVRRGIPENLYFWLNSLNQTGRGSIAAP